MSENEQKIPTDAEVEELEDRPEQQQQVQSINASQFREQVRQLMDIAFQSGIEPEEVSSILDDLSEGCEYYHESLIRYSRLSEEGEDG